LQSLYVTGFVKLWHARELAGSFVSMKRDASRAFNLVLRASLLVQPKTFTIDMILSCNIDTECGKLLFSHGIFM